MKYILTFIILALSTCEHSDSPYKKCNCKDSDYSGYRYDVLKKEPAGDSVFSAHVIVRFKGKDTVSYDAMACALIEICRKEHLVKAFFYHNRDCLYVNDSIMNNRDIFDAVSFYNCYIGRVDIKGGKNQLKLATTSDVHFETPPGKQKF